MSPEQASGGVVDGRPDLYALACVLYEMLAGQPPFTGPSVESIVHQHRVVPPPPITNLRPSTPIGISGVLERALAKVPADRYASVGDFSRALEGTLTGTEPRLASAESKSRVRRGTRFAMLVALAVVLVVTAGVWMRLRSTLRAPGRIESLAVLPLENLSGDTSQEYFADGMTDELITALAQLGRLRVISRTSAMHFRRSEKPLHQIARELDVDAIVEGSIMRSGDRVRITAQLIETSKDRHLWAHSYERDLKDVLALQSEVARTIAGEIGLTLTPQAQARLGGAKPVDPEAYETYLRGRYFWNKRSREGLDKAVDYLGRAVALDPGYAPAYAGLADAYLLMIFHGVRPQRECCPLAKAAALKALQLDDRLAQATGTWRVSISRGVCTRRPSWRIAGRFALRREAVGGGAGAEERVRGGGQARILDETPRDPSGARQAGEYFGHRLGGLLCSTRGEGEGVRVA